MKNKISTSILILGISLIIILTGSLPAQVKFSGDISAVSTYVWRGIKANNGPALQGTASFTYSHLTVGLLCSSINYGDDKEVETDPYLEIALPNGNISTSIGATVYIFDFRTFDDYADYEYELFFTAGYGPVGLSGFYVPKQKSTEFDTLRSNYWLELSGESTYLGADISAAIGYGTYSSRWMPKGRTKDAVSLLLLTAGKPITQNFSVTWNYSIDLGSDFENIFYLGAYFSF
jgi:uncharacterized protein (TIGR02001 family)